MSRRVSYKTLFYSLMFVSSVFVFFFFYRSVASKTSFYHSSYDHA